MAQKTLRGDVVAYIDDFPRKIGAAFDGRGRALFSIKLDFIPVGQWDGWFSIFPPDDRTEEEKEAAKARMHSRKNQEQGMVENERNPPSSGGPQWNAAKEKAKAIADKHLTRPVGPLNDMDDDIPF